MHGASMTPAKTETPMSTPAPSSAPPDASKRRIPLDVVDAQGNSFYVSERKVFPRDVAGTLNRLRVAAVWWLLGMYYAVSYTHLTLPTICSV